MGGVSEETITAIADGFARLVESCLTGLPTKLTSRRSTPPTVGSATFEDSIYLDKVDSSMFFVQVQLGAITDRKNQRQARNAEFSTAVVAEVKRQLAPHHFNVTYGALVESRDDSLINLSIRCVKEAETKALYAKLLELKHINHTPLNTSLVVTSFHATTAADGSRVIKQVQDRETSVLEGNPDLSRVLDGLNHSGFQRPIGSLAPPSSPRRARSAKETGCCSCCPPWWPRFLGGSRKTYSQSPKSSSRRLLG